MSTTLNSPEESLNVPAHATAGVWAFHRVALSAPHTDTDIIAVALEMQTDKGAFTFYLDGLRATNQEADKWRVWPRKLWRIEKESADLIIKQAQFMGYALIKIIGGKKPALLTADSNTSEVPAPLLIAKALELAYRSVANLDEARHWDNTFNRIRRNLPMNVGTRQAA